MNELSFCYRLAGLVVIIVVAVMPGIPKSTPISQYFAEIQKLLGVHSEFLTRALPHNAERGRNDEEVLRAFLQRVLPRKYSIGSGFAVCSDPEKEPSSQIDVVIHDDLLNLPVQKELAACIYPIETIYSTVEVKGKLRKSAQGRPPKTDLARALESVVKIRRLAETKIYWLYDTVAVDPRNPDRRNVRTTNAHDALPPRSYLFAFNSTGWKNIEALREDMEMEIESAAGSFLHGVVVLKRDWFLRQVATGEGTSVRIECFRGNALLRFLYFLLRDMQSVPMYPIALERYFDPGFFEATD